MGDGMAMSDFRSKAMVGKLQRSPNGNHQAVDPIAEALATKRGIAAATILDRAVAETTTAALEAENARLEAQIRRKQLEEMAAQKGGDRRADAEWGAFILEQLKATQDQLRETQQALSQQQQQAMEERMTLLQGELERLRAPQEAVSPAAQVKSAIDEARALMEIVSPPRPPAPPQPKSGQDAALQAWTLKAQLDQERWRQEQIDRHTEEMAKIDALKEVEAAKVAIEREKGERMDRFINQTGPQLLEVGQKLLAQFVGATGGAGAGAPPSPAPAVAPLLSPPPGVETASCTTPGCGSTLLFRPSWPEVICQRCGAVYQLAPPPEPARPASPGRGQIIVEDEEGGIA